MGRPSYPPSRGRDRSRAGADCGELDDTTLGHTPRKTPKQAPAYEAAVHSLREGRRFCVSDPANGRESHDMTEAHSTTERLTTRIAHADVDEVRPILAKLGRSVQVGGVGRRVRSATEPVPVTIMAFRISGTEAHSAGHEKPLEHTRPSGCPISSRGGTRTRDPGIMSAVL